MSVPRIEIELDKLSHNARKLIALYGSKRIHIVAVTKGLCGSPRIANPLLKSGFRCFGDSRTPNVRELREGGIDAQFTFIRSPMPSRVERVLESDDVSLDTKIAVMQLLADEATRCGRSHRVSLMVGLAYLREGILPSDLEPVVKGIIGMQGMDPLVSGRLRDDNLLGWGSARPWEERAGPACSSAWIGGRVAPDSLPEQR